MRRGYCDVCGGKVPPDSREAGAKIVYIGRLGHEVPYLRHLPGECVKPVERAA